MANLGWIVSPPSPTALSSVNQTPRIELMPWFDRLISCKILPGIVIFPTINRGQIALEPVGLLVTSSELSSVKQQMLFNRTNT